MRRFLFGGAVVASAAAAALVAGMSGHESTARAAIAATYKTYLSVAGIPGEVTDTTYNNYTNQIAIDTFSWSTTTPVAVSSTTSTTSTGKPQLSPLVVTMAEDRSVPLLELYSQEGKVIPTVLLTEINSTGQVVTTIALTNAFVTKLALTNSVGDRNNVQVEFTYTRERTSYGYQATSGAVPQMISSCWDVPTNAAC